MIKTPSSSDATIPKMFNVMPLVGKLEEVARDLLKLAEDDKQVEVRFSDEDCINALIIFNNICSNRAVVDMMEKNVPPEIGNAAVIGYGNSLRSLFKQVTGIDPQVYFKNLPK